MTRRIFPMYTFSKKTTRREKKLVHEKKFIFIIFLFARGEVSVKRFASFDPLISVIGLNSQAWRAAWKKAKRERRKRSRVSVWVPHLRTHARKSRSAAKREQKASGCSRAVGQMFKQTSNYLNSIWDLRGVPAPRKYRPPSPTSVTIWVLLGPLDSVSFLLSFFGSPPKMSSAGLHVKSTRLAFHSLPVLSPSSPLCPADSDRQPFLAFSLSLSPSSCLSLSLSNSSFNHCATMGCVCDVASTLIQLEVIPQKFEKEID